MRVRDQPELYSNTLCLKGKKEKKELNDNDKIYSLKCSICLLIFWSQYKIRAYYKSCLPPPIRVIIAINSYCKVTHANLFASLCDLTVCIHPYAQ